jgi:hypothetical protein
MIIYIENSVVKFDGQLSAQSLSYNFFEKVKAENKYTYIVATF